MPAPIEREDTILVLRFVRAVAIALLALFALCVTVAMFWRDIALPSFFDEWLGSLSEGALTLLTLVVDLIAIFAVRATQRSEARFTTRRSGRR